MPESPDLAFLRSRIERLQQESSSIGALPTGGGGNNFGGMEPRIAKLEADVAHLTTDTRDIRGDLKDLRTSLADVRERMVGIEVKLDHLPGKGFVVVVVTTGLALLTAVLLFQDKIQHAFGIGPLGK